MAGGHSEAVLSVSFGPDGWRGSGDTTVHLWDLSTHTPLFTCKGHWVNSLALSTEYVIRSGAFDHTGKQYSSPNEMKKVWEIRTQKLKQDLPGHADEVFAVDWSPDGEKVASGVKDKVLKLWMG